MFFYQGHVWFIRHRGDVWLLIRDDVPSLELTLPAHDAASAERTAWCWLRAA